MDKGSFAAVIISGYCLKERAQALGIPLLSNNSLDSDVPYYPNSLTSYGGPGLWEYDDILGGVQDHSQYTIPAGEIQSLYTPLEDHFQFTAKLVSENKDSETNEAPKLQHF